MVKDIKIVLEGIYLLTSMVIWITKDAVSKKLMDKLMEKK